MDLGRNTTSDIKNALADTPIVLLNGARQVGKSTLARHLFSNYQAYTFDDISVLAAAQASPVSFIERLREPTLIDEIQRAPEIFLPLKKTIDEDRRPGRFLLTGSANILTLPKLADSLAGRMEIHTLWPLSQGERDRRQETFIDACFSGAPFNSVRATDWKELINRLVLGGYPEVSRRPDGKRRKAWFSSYITSLLERDVRDLAQIAGLQEMPLLLQILASRIGGLQNFSDISRITGLTLSTLKRYVTLLEALFLYIELPGWHRNLGKRLIKAPKTYLNDTGLVCYLRGVNETALEEDRNRVGPILENFVVMELKKQRAWSQTTPQLYHFRDVVGKEVDIVLEAADGRVVGVEVKTSVQVASSDFNGLRTLAELTKKDFVCGVIFYTGKEILPFGENLYALPIRGLWEL